MAELVASFIVRLRWLWIALSVLLLVGFGMGIGKIGFESDARIFFAKDNPDRIALDAFETSFAKDDTISLVLVPSGKEVFTPATLKAIDELTRQAWLLPHVRRVDSVTNFQYSYAEGDSLTVRDLVEDPGHIGTADAARAKTIALKEVGLLHSVIPPASDVTAVHVIFRLPGNDVQTETPEIVTATQTLVQKFRTAHPEIAVKLTGSLMMNNQFAVSGQEDGKNLTPAMVLAFLVCLAIALRSIVSAGLALLIVGSAIVVALGALGWVGGRLNSMSVMAPLIIMTITVANVGHFLSAVRRNMLLSEDRKEWVLKALSENIVAITVAMLTTVAGFLALNFSISPPFQQLGNIVAAGEIAGLFFTLCLLPALVILVPISRHTKKAMVNRAMVVLAEFVIRRYKAILMVSAVTVGIVSFGISQIKLQDDFVRYFDERYELRRDMDFYEARLGGHNAFEYALPANSALGISDPRYLADVSAFVTWLRQQPEVTFVRSLTDTLARLNMNMHGDDPNFYRIPETKEKASQYLFLYELSLPYGIDLTDQINVDRSATRVTVTMANVSTAQMQALNLRASKWLDANAPSLQVTPTGLSYVFSEISYRDVRAMLKGTTISLIGISILLLFILRDVRLGVISLIPNLLPIILAFGVWGYLIGTVTLAIAVVVAMTLGIIVDDTSHFLIHFKTSRRNGKMVEHAIREAFDTVGMSMVVNSIGLIIGFSILAQSGFAVNGDMAKLTAMIIAFAILGDIFLLPSVLIAFFSREKV